MENKINIGVWISLLIIIIPSSRERDFTFCFWMLSKSWIPKLRHNHTGHALVRTYTYYCPTFIYAQEQAGCKFTMKFGSNFQRDPHLSRLCSHQATECGDVVCITYIVIGVRNWHYPPWGKVKPFLQTKTLDGTRLLFLGGDVRNLIYSLMELFPGYL